LFNLKCFSKSIKLYWIQALVTTWTCANTSNDKLIHAAGVQEMLLGTLYQSYLIVHGKFFLTISAMDNFSLERAPIKVDSTDHRNYRN